MELVQYIRLFRRWLWLILLAAFVGAGVSFIIRVNQSPIYSARATVIVGSALASPNPNSTEIRTGIDLAITYAQIVRTYDILNSVIVALDLPITTDELSTMIDTAIVSGTSLLEISVTDTDRILTTEIANEIVLQLILQSPSNLTADQQVNIDLLQTEIDAQTQELAVLRTDLRQINQQIEDDNFDNDQRANLLTERSILTTQINDASANIAQNLNTIASLTQRTNSVEIIETARIPTEPIGISLASSVVLGVLVASFIAFAVLVVYEYLNDTVRSADELSSLLNLPVLGIVAKFGKKDMTYQDRLIVNLQNFSQTAEEYRTLRTNLLYSAAEEERVFVISSASPQEGKSVTTTNLAISLAQSGLRVLLIDADLRRPKVHEAFGLQNQIGLTNLLSGRIANTKPSEDSRTKPQSREKARAAVLDKNTWRQVAQKTSIPNLIVITSGFIPNNPSELLGSPLMKRWMSAFRESSAIDLVIFDSPPALSVSDSSVIAASLDAKVILVVQANRTRRGVVMKAKERFDNVNASIVGVVLNSVNLRDEDYYGYDYSYYAPKQPTPKKLFDRNQSK